MKQDANFDVKGRLWTTSVSHTQQNQPCATPKSLLVCNSLSSVKIKVKLSSHHTHFSKGLTLNSLATNIYLAPGELGREPYMRCLLPHHLTNACFMEWKWKRASVRNFPPVENCLSKLQRPSHHIVGVRHSTTRAGQKGLGRLR